MSNPLCSESRKQICLIGLKNGGVERWPKDKIIIIKLRPSSKKGKISSDKSMIVKGFPKIHEIQHTKSYSERTSCSSKHLKFFLFGRTLAFLNPAPLTQLHPDHFLMRTKTPNTAFAFLLHINCFCFSVHKPVGNAFKEQPLSNKK
jgi:hypothetical protein